MSKSLDQFKKNINSIETVDGIYLYFESKVKAMDISEILRAQYVMLVSAFDYYIHDIVREGMLEIFDGERKTNKPYEQFCISLKSLQLVLATTDSGYRRTIIDNEIRKITCKHTYQAPNNVEKALSLISIKSIWETTSKNLKVPKEDIIKKMGLIVNRRNKIAHEADIDPVTLDKTPIDRTTLLEVKQFLISLVEIIDKKI